MDYKRTVARKNRDVTRKAERKAKYAAQGREARR